MFKFLKNTLRKKVKKKPEKEVFIKDTEITFKVL